MPSIETLQRAAEILERLSAGGKPDARTLAGAPLAQAWATMPGEDLCQIAAAVATPPEAHARPHLVLLLAIDRGQSWALVLDDRDLGWWVLGDPLPGASTPEDGAEVLRLATAWVRRQSQR
jgi:hypothetical protein